MADGGPLAIGQTFGTRYHVMRLLGAGGMGAVYQAWDAELSVAVAIKVIRPEVMADSRAAAEIERRFKRELLLARQVTHKNVVRIHDLGEINGIKYITMPYVEGSDLATLLKKKGRLPAERVLRIARSVVSGLVEAHKKDIVHRDLKPANIMIDAEDEALIMDFGIARSTGRPTGGQVPGATTIVNTLRHAAVAPHDATMLGAVVGTVEYMAPEQAKGLEVDQRADIYAFGLILYDLLIGIPRAKQAGSAIAELQARMERAPAPVRSALPHVPVALDALVARCLEPDAAKRYQTTQELADELARLDDKGDPIPIKRVVGLPVAVAAMLLLVAVLGTTWWFTRDTPIPQEHEPVSVLIADFHNSTSDTSFDNTLEPIVKLALEGAGFVSAYDRVGIKRSLGIQPPDELDERAAQDIALKAGVNVIVTGALTAQGSGYRIAMRAVRAVTGEVIVDDTTRASGKDQVLGAATGLADTIRTALGDDTSDTAQRFGKYTLTSTSVDAVHAYAAGMIAISNSRFDEARQRFMEAVERDPSFGMGWTALAMAEFNLDRLQDAKEHVEKAIEHIDSMTERERYRTRGLMYMLTNDYGQCRNEYGELVKKYAADASARNNLALCLTYLRQPKQAVQEMEQVVKLLPNRALYRENLSLYASYAGDFAAGEREARALQDPGVFALLALAFAQLGQGQLVEAAQTYEALGTIDAQGASYRASGLGDLAVYEGRFSDAARLFETGADADLAAKDLDRAAAKLVALAQARLLNHQKDRAVAAAEKALANSAAVKVRFLAGRIFVEAGEFARAKALAAGLSSELQAAPQAYAKILEGETALMKKDPRQAIRLLTEANELLDTWIARFDLGRAHLAAGAFLQADSELDACLDRKGEALSLFLDEEPTSGILPLVYYYQGRVREELKTARFAASYEAYLKIRGKSTEDRLLPDVRRRIGK